MRPSSANDSQSPPFNSSDPCCVPSLTNEHPQSSGGSTAPAPRPVLASPVEEEMRQVAERARLDAKARRQRQHRDLMQFMDRRRDERGMFMPAGGSGAVAAASHRDSVRSGGGSGFLVGQGSSQQRRVGHRSSEDFVVPGSAKPHLM